MVEDGTGWYRMVQDGTGWYRMVEDVIHFPPSIPLATVKFKVENRIHLHCGWNI